MRKGEERGEKDKLCSGTVGKWQFFTWPSFLIFSSLLQPYEGSLIKVYKMIWEYFHDKSLLSFHKHHQSLFVAEIWLTRLKDKWPDWERNFCTHFNSSLEFGAIKAWSTANLPQLLKWKLLQLRSFLTTIESTSKTILKRLFGMLSVFLMKNSNRTYNSILLSRRTIGY